ncbi:MAG TPA: hypothetical protein VES67_09480 [Vicinamibacterales bacterium]|nr:hypothetical protein [Vicinamibacterales bacterium]
MAEVAGVTLKQAMDTVRDAAVFGLAWFLFQRLGLGWPNGSAKEVRSQM